MFKEERFDEPIIIHPQIMGWVGLVLLIAALFGACTMTFIERVTPEVQTVAGLL